MKYNVGDLVLLGDDAIEWYLSRSCIDGMKSPNGETPEQTENIKNMLYAMYNIKHYSIPGTIIYDSRLQRGNYRLKFGEYETNVAEIDLIPFAKKEDLLLELNNRLAELDATVVLNILNNLDRA